ncbi:MAG: MGMT family protein [Vicinamibacteria bacterium]
MPLVVPCHRVVASGGILGNYSGFGSTETKRRLLQLERAPGFAPQPTQTRLL